MSMIGKKKVVDPKGKSHAWRRVVGLKSSQVATKLRPRLAWVL